MFSQLNKKIKGDWIVVLFLLVLSAGFIFYRLGLPVLEDWDEGIYSNIAGEIASSGSWWHLELQGTPWLEKEPLGFWFTALAIKVFGFTTFALRFSSALFSVFIAPLFYLLARRFANKFFSFLLTLLFFFSPVLWHAHMLRAGDLNAIGLATFLAALTAYVYWRDSKHYWLIGMCVALNFLTRGFFGILLLGIIIFAEFVRPYFKQFRWPVSRFILITTIALLPWLIWHLTQYLSYPAEYIRIYWQEQFFSRIYLPLQNHSGDWLFYWRFLKAKLGLIYLLIGGASVACGIFVAFKRKDWLTALLVIWLLAILLPLEIMQTKLNWYVLPSLPVFYLLAGQMFWRIYQKTKSALASIHLVIVICALVFAVHLGVLVHTRVTALRNITLNPTLPESGPWYEGKVLPAYYWYSHFEKK